MTSIDVAIARFQRTGTGGFGTAAVEDKRRPEIKEARWEARRREIMADRYNS